MVDLPPGFKPHPTSPDHVVSLRTGKAQFAPGHQVRHPTPNAIGVRRPNLIRRLAAEQVAKRIGHLMRRGSLTPREGGFLLAWAVGDPLAVARRSLSLVFPI